MSIWTLPGPDRFLNRTLESLDGGGVVVVRLPATLDGDAVWAECVRRRHLREFALVDATEASDAATPADTVAAQVGLDHAGWTAATLVRAERLAGVAACIVGVERAPDGRRWASFVAEFAAASQSAGFDANPPALMLLTTGEDRGCVPEAGPTVQVMWWWNVVSRLDLAVHLDALSPALDAVDREQIIEIAGMDVELAERCVVEGCRDGDSLVSLAAERGRELGLDGLEVSRGRPTRTPDHHLSAWGRGAVDVFGGSLHWHTSVLALHDRTLVERRLWTAQVRTLLPQIDLWRVEVIETAREHGLLPTAELTNDLEIKELRRRLRPIQSRHRLADITDWLLRSRNMLAHLETIPPDTRDHGRELARRARLS